MEVISKLALGMETKNKTHKLVKSYKTVHVQILLWGHLLMEMAKFSSTEGQTLELKLNPLR